MPSARTSPSRTAPSLKPLELSSEHWAALELDTYTSFAVRDFGSIRSLWANVRKALTHHLTPAHLQALELESTFLWQTDPADGTFLMTIEVNHDLWLASDPIEITDVASKATRPGPDAARAVLEFLLAVRNQRIRALTLIGQGHTFTSDIAAPAKVHAAVSPNSAKEDL